MKFKFILNCNISDKFWHLGKVLLQSFSIWTWNKVMNWITIRLEDITTNRIYYQIYRATTTGKYYIMTLWIFKDKLRALLPYTILYKFMNMILKHNIIYHTTASNVSNRIKSLRWSAKPRWRIAMNHVFYKHYWQKWKK